MIDAELKDLIRKAYKAGRRNALKQDEANLNDFVNKHESKLKLFAIPVVVGRSEQLKDKEVLDFDEWQIANYNLVNFGLYKSKKTGDLDSKKGLLNKYCSYRENL